MAMQKGYTPLSFTGAGRSEFLSVAKEAFMGVTVRQKENGKGKPWWVFIKVQGG